MNKIINYFYNKFSRPICLSDFISVITTINHNKTITYFDRNNMLDIGYIEYNINSGKICLFFITNEKYRNRGLGRQILENVLIDMKQNGIKRVWLVTGKYPHPFWEQNGFIYAKPPDNSVISHGYTINL